MSISLLQPLHIGNAIRIFLNPPAGAVAWRILKMGNDGFAGPEDLDYALIAYEGDERVFVDSENLRNEQKVFYKAYYRMGDGSMQESPTADATPVASYEDHSTDALSVLRQRLEDGLKVECDRKNIIHEYGHVQVLTAPPALDQNLRFPLVTLTLEDESPAERGIGENISGDEFYPLEDSWFESDGWIAGVRISIVAWSLNSDERIEMRKAIRRIILGNIPVFSSVGMDLVNLTMSDVDALNGEYNANIYQVMGTFTCIAPIRVGGSVAPTADVTTDWRP